MKTIQLSERELSIVYSLMAPPYRAEDIRSDEFNELRNKVFYALRDAQNDEHVSQRYKLPVIGWLRSDYNSDDKRDPNAPLFMLGSNDPTETWGVKYIPLAGNYPVTPDGLVSCGENCWSCGKYFTYEQHSECDGYCPHCNSPVDLDDEEEQPSKVVPTEPTEEMISNAWREAIGKCDHETIKRIYATMLAAAPQQEVKNG